MQAQAAAAAAAAADEASSAALVRTRRDLTDLASEMKTRRERRLERLAARLSSQGARRRRHNHAECAAGPLMRIDGGEMVPLPINAPVVDAAAEGEQPRGRRHALHRAPGRLA